MGPWGCPGGMTGLAGSSVPLDGLWCSGGRFPFWEAASMFCGWCDAIGAYEAEANYATIFDGKID
jgi:hypothetical protein